MKALLDTPPCLPQRWWLQKLLGLWPRPLPSLLCLHTDLFPLNGHCPSFRARLGTYNDLLSFRGLHQVCKDSFQIRSQSQFLGLACCRSLLGIAFSPLQAGS